MSLKIQPHGRLQEWIADEKGYFTDEGLEYEFVKGGLRPPVRDEHGQIKSGAFESYEDGREAGVSCACHWAVNTAAVDQLGKLVGDIYSVTPCAIMVAPESDVRRAEDLAGVDVAVGYHSGSHFTTLQALEAVLPADDVKISFEGSPAARLDGLVDRTLTAATIFGVELYVAQALGFRAILDATFMVAFLANTSGADPSQVNRYVNGLKRAQMELDLRPEPYKHHHLKSVPERYRNQVDVRQFGPGERIVFLPYTGETYETTQNWIQERHIFEDSRIVSDYGAVVLS